MQLTAQQDGTWALSLGSLRLAVTARLDTLHRVYPAVWLSTPGAKNIDTWTLPGFTPAPSPSLSPSLSPAAAGAP